MCGCSDQAVIDRYDRRRPHRRAAGDGATSPGMADEPIVQAAPAVAPDPGVVDLVPSTAWHPRHRPGTLGAVIAGSLMLLAIGYLIGRAR